MESKLRSICNIEKQIKSCYKKYAERKNYNYARGLKCYYENKDKISNQRTIHFEREDNLKKKQKDRYIHFEESVRTYVEIENRLKALEGKTDNKSS